MPTTLTVSLVDVDAGCAPISGARVDVWHCDADGAYSGFQQAQGETFCRGIQLTDDNGQVTFQTIYPGWYPGRITHIHFQVFFGDGQAATSQIAFPEDVTEAVYASPTPPGSEHVGSERRGRHGLRRRRRVPDGVDHESRRHPVDGDVACRCCRRFCLNAPRSGEHHPKAGRRAVLVSPDHGLAVRIEPDSGEPLDELADSDP